MFETQIQPQRPVDRLNNIACGLWLSRALWVACRLRVPDAIGDEPEPIDAIAARTGSEPSMLRRLLNMLSAFGVFASEDDGRFVHTDLSLHLKSTHPESQRSFIEAVFGGEHYAAWGGIEHSLRTGETAFDSVFGMPVFDHFGRNPESARLFSEAMTGTTRAFEDAVLAAHEFKPFDVAVDVGGSRGSLLAGVLDRQPHGRGILFDLPEIIEDVRPSLESSRIDAAAGDFFERVPEGDLYLLKFILHDWTDAQCAIILRNIRTAIRPGGRLAIAELVLPEYIQPHFGYMMDVNMMVMTGGRERSLSEYVTLLEPAGFQVERMTPTQSPMSVIEAIAV